MGQPLALTALACLVLGMEVPTTAAYVICVSVRWPCPDRSGRRALASASFHLLVRASFNDHAPRLRGPFFIAAGMVNENWAEGRRRGYGAGRGSLSDPTCNDRAP